LIEGGMTPMEAITAATRTAAELLGASDRIGSVQAGRYADLVAVAGDPLQRPELLARISFVMKGGQIVRRNGAAQVESPAHGG
jgi:imidazolonepropionase-like amidohydrolase